ncbi:TPA: 3-deoxy-manno-octulosonate cytidylyltransferase [Campylobacter jejuni]|nr:3-deoxy-manno-octulosonate cytidylyltransferase [Campylobacter jejuni]
MKIICVIPARYHSTRFPGKPLVDIFGKPMIWWVYEEAKKLIGLISEIYVATEDERVAQACYKLNLNVIMTSNKHPTGTDRVAEVSTKVDADAYLIWMGDEPLINHREILFLIEQFKDKQNYSAYMLAKSFTNPVDVVNPTTIKLAINNKQELIFMSRSLIPFPKASLNFQYYKNIGAYILNKQALNFFLNTSVGYLENIEEIELLRFLENHKKVHVSILERSLSLSVDTHKDLEKIKEIIKQTGKNIR